MNTDKTNQSALVERDLQVASTWLCRTLWNPNAACIATLKRH